MRGMPTCERDRTQVHMYSGSVVLLLEILLRFASEIIEHRYSIHLVEGQTCVFLL